MPAGILASALLSWAYARGGAGWALGFVALVPWLITLDASRTWASTLLNAWAMSVAFTAAVFAWFGIAIGHYTQWGGVAGVSVLLLAAPLFQPQFLAFALVRRWVARRHGPMLCALAAASAWVASEWLLPRVLGDTLGHGLHPSRVLRQGADAVGAAGLTLLLLLANEGVAAALSRRTGGLRAVARPLAAAAAVPLLLALYGAAALQALPAPEGKPLRMGLVQSNIVDYERLRREKGADAVVREVLDTHFAMSYDAIERQHADAVLWSETVYPTTFGHPRSEAGAEFDREILDTVAAAGVPFVFGTYDTDAAGEYNAAAFVAPGTGLLGFYRKTRLFPFSEHVPAWLDGPLLRRWLPWAGTWRPGEGARVFPLRLADGREVPVQPLICLDDVDTGLAVDGARLGAQALLTLSNDSWFSRDPRGAELHQAAAAFRSIETRLPQFRVTTSGHSAVIDATGTVVAGSRMGERSLVLAELAVPVPPRTLIVAWGDWVGRVAAAFLALLAMAAVARRWAAPDAQSDEAAATRAALPAGVAVLPPLARLAAGALRVFARGSLLWMVAAFVAGGAAMPSNTLAQIRSFGMLFLVPELAAWFVLQAFAARMAIERGALVLAQGRRRLALPLPELQAVEPWRVPIPCAGASVRLRSGERWPYGIAHPDPAALARALAAAGAPLQQSEPSRASLHARGRAAMAGGWLARPFAKFALFPLALTIPAFRLHQHIAYGSTFGEYDSFGLKAYLVAFGLWWAAWVIAVVLCAAALRAAIEAGTLASVWLQPRRALDARRWFERAGLAVLYLGMPAWLLLRVYGS